MVFFLIVDASSLPYQKIVGAVITCFEATNIYKYIWSYRNVKSCVYNIFDEVSNSKYSGFKKAIWLKCTQEAGEIIFVPSGWYHQVHNLVKLV
ncbi:2-oxoglutarate and iron-dependent oxygenase JMJD4 [Trifolium repens]|nr:2-oxoglutarate and iron-dependent oxygenase JMJD4 [Trifolium repens]